MNYGDIASSLSENISKLEEVLNKSTNKKTTLEGEWISKAGTVLQSKIDAINKDITTKITSINSYIALLNTAQKYVDNVKKIEELNSIIKNFGSYYVYDTDGQIKKDKNGTKLIDMERLKKYQDSVAARDELIKNNSNLLIQINSDKTSINTTNLSITASGSFV